MHISERFASIITSTAGRRYGLVTGIVAMACAACVIVSCQSQPRTTTTAIELPPLARGSTAAESTVTSVWKTPLPAGAGVVITAGEEWRPIDMRDPAIQRGSALDFSGWWDGRPAGSDGQVIVGPQGRLVFANVPTKRAVFWGCAVNMGPGGSFGLRHDISTIDGDHNKVPLTKGDIAAFARRMRLQGYNLFRPHFLDSALMENAKPSEAFDPVALDNFDYLVACLKDNGIYLYLDAMTRPGGWSHGNGWDGDGVNRKATLYVDDGARQLWQERVSKLLTHTNPYTGTALIADPQVAMLLFCNEQELDPWGMEWFPKEVLPGFRKFIQAKYATDAALRTAWTDAKNHNWLPDGETRETVTADRFWGDSPRSRDIGLYMYQAETDLLAWYETTIRAMGFRGITSQFDCGMRYRDTQVRSSLKAVSIHAYGAPIGGSRWITKGGTQSQNSSIGAPDVYRDLLFFRYTADSRFLDRPLLVTEYDLEFWNKFRHERGLGMAGYAALQDYDALIPHAHPVLLSIDRPAVTYYVGSDPIGRATEVVSDLLFVRRDVTPATGKVAIRIDEKFLFDESRSGGGLMWEKEQDRLALVTGFGVATTDRAGVVHGVPPGTIDLPIRTLPTTTEVVTTLKRNGVLAADNRTDPAAGIFESEGGQLLLQRGRSQLELSTPRSQGASLLAGATAMLPAVSITATSVDAAITVHALDDQPIASAKRLLVVIATDALNSDMAFTDATRTGLLSIGNSPCLVRAGKFSLTVSSTHAAGMQLWGLGIDGHRAEQLACALAADGRLSIDLDTAKTTQPYLFFEVVLSDAR